MHTSLATITNHTESAPQPEGCGACFACLHRKTAKAQSELLHLQAQRTPNGAARELLLAKSNVLALRAAQTGRCDDLPDSRSQIALRQMVSDGQVDADVARADRRRDWPLRIDADILRAEIRLGLRNRQEVAAEFQRRGMPIRTAVRLLAMGRVAA